MINTTEFKMGMGMMETLGILNLDRMEKLISILF